tara:strand:+ start:75 stop:617 length:543 start_codon:yes stop_codon:yes gene_type:complete
MPISINGQTGAVTGLAALPDSAMASGSIIQVKQTVKTDTTSYSTAASFADISGISVTITPSSTSNKILVFPDLALGSSDMEGYHCVWRLLRGSTPIGVSTSATTANLTGTGGLNIHPTAGNAYNFGTSKMFLDSPSTTSATTYKCQWSANDSNATLFLNRRGGNTEPGGISTITVMEVAG